MEIPTPEQSKSRFVLSLGSNKWKCFNAIDFQAAILVGSMIGIVLAELDGNREVHRNGLQV